jgi:hypothetical protein
MEKSEGRQGTGRFLGKISQAINECLRKPSYDYQRIIIVLAQDEGRFSELRNGLSRRFDLSAMPLSRGWPSGEIRAKPFLLLVDAMTILRRETLHRLRFLVNHSPVVFIVFMRPAAHAKWQRQWPMEAAQIRRRTHALFSEVD